MASAGMDEKSEPRAKPSPQAPQRQIRAEREAAALRANLARRKAQARARDTRDPPTKP